jgi:hypothetical protein
MSFELLNIIFTLISLTLENCLFKIISLDEENVFVILPKIELVDENCLMSSTSF